jgi:hypothetical protein
MARHSTPTWVFADDFLSFPRIVSEMYQRLDTGNVIILTERWLEISTFLSTQDRSVFASFFTELDLSLYETVIVTDVYLFRLLCQNASLDNLVFIVSRGTRIEDVEAIDPFWKENCVRFSETRNGCQKLFATELIPWDLQRCTETIQSYKPHKNAKHVVVCSPSFRQDVAQALSAKEISGTVQQRKNAISKFNFSGSICVLSEAPLRELVNVEYIHMLIPSYELYSSILYFCYNENYRKPGALYIVFYVDEKDEKMCEEYNETAQRITAENNNLRALLKTA